MRTDDTRYPENTDTVIYITGGHTSIQDLIDKAREKWGEDVNLDDLLITGEHIQTRCFGYDLYDSADYTDFIMIELLK